MILLQSLEAVEDVLRGDNFFIDPALLAFCGLDFDETTSMLKDLEFVPVFDGAGAI